MKPWWKIGAGLLIAGVMFGTQFDDMTNDLKKVLDDGSKQVAASLAKNVGYYTGSGNVTPANASGFLGLKVGLGAGTALPGYLWPVIFSGNTSSLTGEMTSKNAAGFEAMAKVVGLLPLSYDMLYAKIGLPVIPMDVGLRLGFFPELQFGTADNYVKLGFFHFGAEARYKITGINLVFAKSQIEARVSYDYDGGVIGASQKMATVAYADTTVIGTNEMTMAMENRWGGSSLGLKVVGGLSVMMFDIYGGVGVNFNFGEVNTALTSKVSFTDTTGSLGNQSVELKGEGKASYDLFNMRLMLGTHFFVSDIALEWNPLNNALAVTIVPISLAF
ncbi:hypothetical protein BREVNS_0178 [Brevinematales bacterium NS]|nr:hypothetical protein [Brevinematales bacterium]QJR20928.1 hypothetical protein BREVNS_0178 [Brevinematales bacterium NS]